MTQQEPPEDPPQQEVRIDPEDGKVRTFEELCTVCACRYTQEEIASYWEKVCRPHTRARFEGTWAHGAKTHVIEGSMLFWQMGLETGIDATSPDAFTMELDGQVYWAKLDAGGQRLVWSDGDGWERREAAPAAGGRDAAPPADGAGLRVYLPGERAKYWSASASKWVAAVVRGQNQDGTYELDIKRRAPGHLLRPAKGRGAGGGLEEVRWRMQLPRALADWQAGDARAFEALLAARAAAAGPGGGGGGSRDEVIRDMLKDAISACSLLGFSSEELEKALKLVKEKRPRLHCTLPVGSFGPR